MHQEDRYAADEVDVVAITQRYLDGDLSPKELSVLNECLRRDERARSHFVRCLLQTVCLEELLAQDRSTEQGQSPPTKPVELYGPAGNQPYVPDMSPPAMLPNFADLTNLVNKDNVGDSSSFAPGSTYLDPPSGSLHFSIPTTRNSFKTNPSAAPRSVGNASHRIFVRIRNAIQLVAYPFQKLGLFLAATVGATVSVISLHTKQFAARSLRTPAAGTRGMLWRPAVLLLLIASACLWFGRSSLPHFSKNLAMPEPSAPELDATALAENTASEFVARIVRMSRDLKWAEPGGQFDFLLRLRRDEPIRIESGFVQIEFFSGAKIVLQGPVVFIPTGPASAQLDSGRLTGDAENGNFRLTTPAAEVIDLGTSFGVSADGTTGTDVVVFKGEVKVVSQPGRAQISETLTLSEGMAARVHTDGTTDYKFQPVESDYSRSIPTNDAEFQGSSLSLVDVLSGGNGLDTCLAGAIHPVTGIKWERGFGDRSGDGKFHQIEWHPLIDGIFVPPQDGYQTQLDSQGHFVDLPPNDGCTWGPVWARRWGRTDENDGDTPDFWFGTTLDRIIPRLKTAQFGIIGMHANVGITLNLQAMRWQQHSSANAFHAVLANLDTSDTLKPTPNLQVHKADFRVYVDGVLKYSRLSFARDDGDAHIAVPLTPDDTRLTLLSTDGEDSHKFDHVVLIDPVLVLEK